MKCISVDREYSLHDGTLKIYDELPAQPYYLRFAKMKGFYFEAQEPLEIKEDKIYGVHLNKIQKVLNSFERTNRNLGVILSGRKGIGKSLFAKILSKQAVDKGYPVIIIDKYIPSMTSVIEDIKQEVVILFDEFDKTFGNVTAADGEASPQDTLLSLFDGLSNGKKLFVITCNELRSLSDYLVNRPGRFHYHLRFNAPTSEEIEEYMRDKLETAYCGEIEKVKRFAVNVELNYDCLRAIAFELNTGIPFEEAIKDLNIMNTDTNKYDLTLYFEGGQIMTCKKAQLDLFNKGIDEVGEVFRDSKNRGIGEVHFNLNKRKFNNELNCNVIFGEDIRYDVDSYYDDESDFEQMKKLKPKYMTIHRCVDKELHYML